MGQCHGSFTLSVIFHSGACNKYSLFLAIGVQLLQIYLQIEELFNYAYIYYYAFNDALNGIYKQSSSKAAKSKAILKRTISI